MPRQPFKDNARDLRRVCKEYLPLSKQLKRHMARVDMSRDNFRERIERIIIASTPERDQRMWMKALQYDTNARFVYDYVLEKRITAYDEESEAPRIATELEKEVSYKRRGRTVKRQRPLSYTPFQDRFIRAKVRLGRDPRVIQEAFNKRFPGSARNIGAIESKVKRLKK